MTTPFAYRADIDGLRAFSVILVFLFHLNIPFISGGFVGVDVFFVISGFLITQIICSEIAQTQRFDFKQFYIRRARRLLPALYMTVTLTSIAGTLLFSQMHMQLLGKSAASVLLFVSNFLFWSQSNYFDVDAVFKPLLHTWSLGIEEQYYLFWPIFLVFVLNITSKRIAVFLFILLACVSFGLNFIFASGHIRYFSDGLATIFFLPVFRIFEFMMGAAIVWIPKQRMHRPILGELAVCIGLILIFFSAITFTNKTLFPSYHALYPCLGAALVILGGKAHILGYLLRNPVAVWIGKRSYSLYLIHWPLIVFTHYWTFHPFNNTEQISIFITAILMSDLMFRYVEQPARTNRPFLKSCISFFSILLSISILSFQQNGWAWRIPEVRRMLLAEDYRAAETAFCDNSASSSSLFTCIHKVNSDKNIYIWGDSHSRHLMPGFSKNYPNYNIKILYLSSCMPQSGLFGYFYDYEGRKFLAQQCAERNRQALAYFKKTHPTNIVIQYFHRVGDAKDKALLQSTPQLTQVLTSLGHHVKIISDVIRPDKPLTECVAVPSTYTDHTLEKRCHSNTQLAYQLRTEDAFMEKKLGHALFLNMSRAFCHKNKCISFLNHKPLFRDDHHLTVEGSEYYVSEAKRYLEIPVSG